VTSDAVRRMGELYENRERLSPSEILDELESIHNSGGVPVFQPPDPERRNHWHYEIMISARKSLNLRPADVVRMLKMLDWGYYYQPGGVDFEIIEAAGRFPSAQIRAPLKAHLEKVQKGMKAEGRGTHRYQSLASQERMLERLIPKCR